MNCLYQFLVAVLALYGLNAMIIDYPYVGWFYAFILVATVCGMITKFVDDYNKGNR